jgi:hypothetical protein
MRSSPVGIPLTAQYACGICRERKVRCDRALPKCRRCDRLNQPCGYNQAHSRRSRDDQLKQLQERLEKTEAQLALTTQTPDISTVANTQAQSAPNIGHTAASTPMDLDRIREMSAVIDAPTNGSSLLGNDLFNSFAEGVDCNMTFDWMHQPLTALEPLDNLLLNQPPSALQSGPEENLSPTDLGLLHNHYFEFVYSSFPFINRDRFETEITRDDGPALSALNYAIALAACSHSPEEHNQQSTCYVLARNYAERCEREDHLNDLNFLQALLLIGRFEAKSRKLERSWLTLGRAAMLCRFLGLHRMDEIRHGQNMQNGELHSDSLFSLPQTEDPVLLEERRRTFWGLYILESYVKTRSGLQCQLGDVKVRNANPHAFQALTYYPGLSHKLTITRAVEFRSRAVENATFFRDYYRIWP